MKMPRRAVIGGVAGLTTGLWARHGRASTPVATPLPDSLPEVEAPFKFVGLELPETWAEVEDYFQRLPDQVHGLARNSLRDAGPERIRVTYGPEDHPLGAPLVLQALSFKNSDFFPPDFTPGQYVAMASGSDDVGATAYGKDQGIAWIQAESYAATVDGAAEVVRPLYTLAWGAIDGPFLFTAAATSAEGLAALVSAFVLAGEQQVESLAPGSPWPETQN